MKLVVTMTMVDKLASAQSTNPTLLIPRKSLAFPLVHEHIVNDMLTVLAKIFLEFRKESHGLTHGQLFISVHGHC